MSNNKAGLIGELTSMLHSHAFYAILEEHKSYLQKEANKFIKAQDLTNAYAAVKSIEDTDKLVRLMQNKLDELKK